MPTETTSSTGQNLSIVPDIFRYEGVSHNNPLRMPAQSWGLDLSKLDPARCHLFLPQAPTSEMHAMYALEHFIFCPGTPSNDLFQFTRIKLNSMNLVWASFPIRFKDMLEKAGRLFNLTFKNTSRNLLDVNQGEYTHFHIPRDVPNIVLFSESRLYETSEKKEYQRVFNAIDACAKLDLD